MILDSLVRDGTPLRLTAEEEHLKRQIYESMNPRRRKFVDRLGYEVWDPFQKPNEPLDMRTDVTRRTVRQLINEFGAVAGANQGRVPSDEFMKGALECALGIINKDEKALGSLAFSLWYSELLNSEAQHHERQI